METPTRTDPPYVPIRKTGWAGQRRAPRWLLLAGALIVAGIVLVALVHKPSQTEQANDLKGFLTDMRTATESCAAGVSESLTALHQIHSAGQREPAHRGHDRDRPVRRAELLPGQQHAAR